MIEKLCQRFPTTDDVRQWRKLAYCLSLCNFNEKGVKRIAECFKCFGNTLGDETVHSYFQVPRARSRVCVRARVTRATRMRNGVWSERPRRG